MLPTSPFLLQEAHQPMASGMVGNKGQPSAHEAEPGTHWTGQWGPPESCPSGYQVRPPRSPGGRDEGQAWGSGPGRASHLFQLHPYVSEVAGRKADRLCQGRRENMVPGNKAGAGLWRTGHTLANARVTGMGPVCLGKDQRGNHRIDAVLLSVGINMEFCIQFKNKACVFLLLKLSR